MPDIIQDIDGVLEDLHGSLAKAVGYAEKAVHEKGTHEAISILMTLLNAGTEILTMLSEAGTL